MNKALDGVFADHQLDLTDDMEKYAAGDINAAELGLRAAGETGEQVGDFMQAPIDFFQKYSLPGAASKFLTDLYYGFAADQISKTDAAKAIGQYAQKNPEVARNVVSAGHALELLPGVSALARGSGGKLLNAFATEQRTHIPGFYDKTQPFGKYTGTLENVGDAAPNILDRVYSPKARAEARELGTGRTRVEEALNPTKTKGDVDRVGNLQASDFMNKQAKGSTADDTFISQLPTVQTGRRGIHTMAEPEAIRADMASDYDVPDDIVDGMFNRTQAAINSPKTGKIERFMSNAFNVGGADPSKAIVVVRDKRAGQSALAQEVRAEGNRTNSKAFSVLTRKRDKFANSIGKDVNDLNAEDYAEMLRVASVVEEGKWKRAMTTKEVKDKAKGVWKDNSLKDLFGTYKEEGIGGLVGRTDEMALPGLRQQIPERSRYTTNKKGEKVYISPTMFLETYWGAKAALRKGKDFDQLTTRQQDVVTTMDKRLENYNPRTVRINERGNVEYDASFLSTEQDLGGVGFYLELDPKTNIAYTMGIDGHDFMGADPAGGVPLWNITPVQKTVLGTSHSNNPTGGKGRPEVVNAAVKKIEDMTGVKRESKTLTKGKDKGKVVMEPLKHFEDRAIRAAREQATPNTKDYIDTLYAGMLTGIATTGDDE